MAKKGRSIAFALLFAGGIAGFVIIAFFTNPFLAGIAIIGLAVWFILPAVLYAILSLLFASIRGGDYGPGFKVLKPAGGAAAFLVFTLVTNHFVFEYYLADAKAYPLEIEPFLEEYRKVHGHYPENL